MIRSRLLLAAYGFFGLILFLAFVTATFPYTDTISTILAPLSMKLIFQQQAISFPIGARLHNVQLISSADEQLLLQSSNITVSPGMLGFFLGEICLRFRAQIFGGVLTATIRRQLQSTMVEFQLESLSLARMSREVREAALRIRSQEEWDRADSYRPGGMLSGELAGRGSAQLMGPDIITASANLVLFGRDVKATFVDGLPPLELGIVRVNLLLGHGIASFQDVRAESADGDLAATGEIHLRDDIANSTVQLTVSLRPSTKARAAFGMFLNMLPHPPSAGPYHLEGPLEFPRVS
jgi:type II secretion system protein N